MGSADRRPDALKQVGVGPTAYVIGLRKTFSVLFGAAHEGAISPFPSRRYAVRMRHTRRVNRKSAHKKTPYTIDFPPSEPFARKRWLDELQAAEATKSPEPPPETGGKGGRLLTFPSA